MRRSFNTRVVGAVLLGLLSALFFTSSYVLNRAMAVGGGHWAWSASIRYVVTLPMLALLIPMQGGFRPVLRAIRAHPLPWLLWSGIGFGLFYACMAYAADSGPSWLVAGSFQLTVIAGMLLSPFIYRDERRRIPRMALALGTVVFAGVLLMQFGHFEGALDAAAWIALGCVVVSAFTYPLGNRKLMLHLEGTGESLTATQRVFGMTLVSQPFWFALAVWGAFEVGLPSGQQLLLSVAVAFFAGVLATVLFFHATSQVRDHPTALGAVEAMQGSEILFASAIGALALGEPWPSGSSTLGALLVLCGITAFALLAGRARPLASAASASGGPMETPRLSEP